MPGKHQKLSIPGADNPTGYLRLQRWNICQNLAHRLYLSSYTEQGLRHILDDKLPFPKLKIKL